MHRKIPVKFFWLETAAFGASLGLQTMIFRYVDSRNSSTTFFTHSDRNSTTSRHDSAENASFSKNKLGK